MVERNLLLALVRRVRRRRRWMAAVVAGAVVAAVGAATLATVTLIRRRVGEAGPDATVLWGVLVATAALAAGAWAARRISLGSCARLIDRAGSGGDSVLAAVALLEAGAAPTPFLDALIVDAVARARRTPPRQVVPPPAPRALVAAAVGIGLLAVAGLVPVSRSRATVGNAAARGARAGVAAGQPVPRLRLPGAALEAEREDARVAIAAAAAGADPELARMADQFQKLLGDLAADGVDAADASRRLEKLMNEAREAARLSDAERSAAEAGRAALAAARNVGSDAISLSDAIAGTTATGPNSAAQAAARLAARGAAGRAALGAAAQSAAAALANPTSTDANARSGEEQSPRRLDRQSDSSPAANDSSGAAPGEASPPRRRLEKLRRDLEETGAQCRTDPDSCRARAASAAAALNQMHRDGRGAQARQRLAEATRQLLDRIRRSGGGRDGDRESMRRFARAARGAPRGEAAGGGVPALVEAPGGGDEPSPRGAGGGGEIVITEGSDDDSGGGATATPSSGASDPRPPSGARSAGDDPAAATHASEQNGSGTGAGSAAGAGAAVAGGGIGSSPGGPVLGARGGAKGGPGGRDAPARLGDDAAGPSRAAVIGSAAARGFASAGYRRVFDDYHAAVEEALDATAVPPGRRYLVRRYFQLIRPRLP